MNRLSTKTRRVLWRWLDPLVRWVLGVNVRHLLHSIALDDRREINGIVMTHYVRWGRYDKAAYCRDRVGSWTPGEFDPTDASQLPRLWKILSTPNEEISGDSHED